MFNIKQEVFTHIRFKKNEIVFPKGQWYSVGFEDKYEDVIKTEERFASNREIRTSIGYKIKSFPTLVQKIAELGYKNHSYNLLFRGQNKDYLDKNGGSKIFPKIFRPEKGKSYITQRQIRERFLLLNKSIELLRKHKKELKLHSGLDRYNEYQIALLQHYELIDTPFLDLTQSIRVASSFALLDSSEGYLFVFGLPHTYGSISFFVDQEIALVKLQNICPPEALRPHYQEGYLVGKLPYSEIKEVGHNISYRLIAKYYLDNKKGKFWNKDFLPIPKNALLPIKDEFEKRMKNILKINGI